MIALGWLASPARGDESLAPGTLSGRLVDPEGRPVAGARVSTDNLDLRIDGKNGRVVAESDAEGRFHLGPLEPLFRSDYVLTFEANGLVAITTPRGAYTVYPGADHDLGTVPLDRGRVFTGTVVDADGIPQAGAAVAVHVERLVRGHSGGDSYPPTTVRADEQGRFRTDPLPVGLLGLVAKAPGRQPAVVNRGIKPGGEEDVGALKLEPGVAVSGFVRDENGQPVAGVGLNVRGRSYTSDERGRFTIDQLGPDESFQVNAYKRGYGRCSGMVTITPAGVASRFERGAQFGPPAAELIVPLRRVGTIQGPVVDADTGAPVKLTRVLLNNLQRNPDGTISAAHTVSIFPQQDPGRYEASLPMIPNSGQFQLVLSAEGYHDAEALTPEIAELRAFAGPAVRMRRDEAGMVPTILHQAITGTVTRDGVPVRNGWVAAWSLPEPHNAPNSAVHRGRTVVEPPVLAATAPIRDGAYALDVPFPNDRLFVIVDEPGRPIAQAGPVGLVANEYRQLDIACTPGGAIRGRVANVPAEWRGRGGYVVAFSRTGIVVDARIQADGSYALPPLPPGEYGLKAGHDAYEDAEVYPGFLARDHPESYQILADPWKRAVRVRVEAGQDVAGVEVAWPE